MDRIKTRKIQLFFVTIKYGHFMKKIIVLISVIIALATSFVITASPAQAVIGAPQTGGGGTAN